MVASVMRSGTHVLIDSILNNFDRYRRRPLYIDLDDFVRRGFEWRRIVDQAGPYVVKTHFPQVQVAGLEEAVTRLMTEAKVLIPRRSTVEILRSSRAFHTGLTEDELTKSIPAFDQFWLQVPHLLVEFTQLIDRNSAIGQIEHLAEYLQESARVPPVLPPDAGRQFKIYLTKLATRLLGDNAPVINTTIGFSAGRSMLPPL